MNLNTQQNKIPQIPENMTPIWTPQEGSQELFMSCPLFEVLYEGTRGPGKTDALIMDFCQHVGTGLGADWRGILFRQTYKQLGDVITKTKKWIPQMWPDAKYNSTEHTWTFATGETLLLRQFMRDDDYWDYHGHEYPWIGWEELCNWSTSNGYLRMMSCCRSSNKDVPRKVRATTNPYGPGHNWVKHRWRLPGARFKPILDSVNKDGEIEEPRVAIYGSLYENKILLEADPKYISRLRGAAKNEAELKAWLYGSWDIVAGGMFDDVWDRRHNVVPNFVVPSSWRIDRSFDWGSSRPFSVGWWAVSDGTTLVLPDGTRKPTVRGDIFRIAEWYGWTGTPNEGKRMLAVDIAKGIVEREIRWGIYGRVNVGPADSSIFDVENGVSIAVDMSMPITIGVNVYNGIQWARANKSPGSRKTGWEKMRKYIGNARPRILMDDGTEKRAWDGISLNGRALPREEPGLFICERCIQFERTVPVLPRKENDPDDVDTDAEDHIGDDVRYRLDYEGMQIRETKTVGMY